MSEQPGIDPAAVPTGTGCAECESGQGAGWWMHLRRCAQCGHIGCCDSSPSQHASHHAAASGHPIIASFEPGEDWFWDFETENYAYGPALAPPPNSPLKSKASRIDALATSTDVFVALASVSAAAAVSFTIVNAVAEAARIAESPSAASVVWTRRPLAAPAKVMNPARRDCDTALPR